MRKRLANRLMWIPLAVLITLLLSVPIIIVSSFIQLMVGNYLGLNKDITLLMQRQFGVNEFTFKQSDFHDYLFDPGGSWWIELKDGFDIKKLTENDKFWVNSDLYHDERVTSEQITSYVMRDYKIEVHGFEAYFAEDQDLGMRICTPSSGCNLSIYAKDGDKNLFIRFGTM